jgi:hypothetical protein
MYLWEIQLEKNGKDNYINQLFAVNRTEAIKKGKKKALELGMNYKKHLLVFIIVISGKKIFKIIAFIALHLTQCMVR